ncbi:MAG: Gfo/Idh/MocA family oxidoreductase [Candidatus Nealsonbacteria bacterium]|nr:Gfo/Idh/MocA family oxidoreductase [Candidatus Nealsonbacteria bacterium]
MTRQDSTSNHPGGTTRRRFLETAAVAGAAAAFAPNVSILGAEAKGANSQLGVGFIGVGGRAGSHINIVKQLQKEGLARPVAVCDVYRPRLVAASRNCGGAKMYDTHEELLQDPAVDVVCIATPDRLHAPQAIDAVNAGKDVYCEKPLTHWSQFEMAKQIERAAAKNKRIVQVGTQYMADENYAKVSKMIEDGIIGKPVHCQLGYFRRGDWGERMTIPDAAAKPGPDLNWKRFLGDAPDVPFSVSRFFQWRLFWDYAGGPATDLLVHTFTPVFCLLGLDYPYRVLGGGGSFQYDRQVTDQCNIIADYKDGPSVVMMNSLSNYTGIETKIRGTNGIILLSDAGIRIVPIDPKTNKETDEIHLKWNGMGDTAKLWRNLIDCVKTRRQPFSPISAAVRVQAPLSMGIIGEQQNKVVMFNFDSETIELS